MTLCAIGKLRPLVAPTSTALSERIPVPSLLVCFKDKYLSLSTAYVYFSPYN